MGGTQCDACREYYRPSKMMTFECNLSQSSHFQNYQNPFFPKKTDFLDILSDNSKKGSFNDHSDEPNNLKAQNYINNKKDEEEKEIKDKQLNKLKNQILEQEKENRRK